MDTAFVGYLVHLETAEHCFLESSNLFEKNSNLPTPKNSCKSKMGRGNRRSSLSYSGARDGTINTRTPKNQEEGRKGGQLRLTFTTESALSNPPSSSWRTSIRYIFLSLYLSPKIIRKKWIGHKSLLQRVQWRCGGHSTKDIPNSPSPQPEDFKGRGRFKGDVLCISIQIAEIGNPAAWQSSCLSSLRKILMASMYRKGCTKRTPC